MFLFQNDYNSMCHPKVLEKFNEVSTRKMVGYGIDEICANAVGLIRKLCQREDAAVHFLSGGTQTNLTVLAAALRPHQAAVAPVGGHIDEHETGAIEATGHKVITLPTQDGKLTPAQVEEIVLHHYSEEGPGGEHMPQPKLVYISVPTELGTMYTLSELEALNAVCKKYKLYLYADGARLGYGLTAPGNDVTMADMARLTDAFYIGGTKLGTMFGEAVVITNPAIAEDFRYLIKQRGGMLAKGWLMGLQFEAMFEDGLYFEAASEANKKASLIRETLKQLGYPMPVDSPTNQVFAVLPDSLLCRLACEFMFTEWGRVDAKSRMVRFCTSWSTRPEEVMALCDKLKELSGNN